eukprot:2789188-Ditylum_brightwellii.AAC.1
MSEPGLLPRRLMTVTPPKCTACTIGAMAKQPWQTKAQPNNIHPVMAPGQCVSVDQLEISMQGFIAQLKGALTKQHYHIATVFTDHYPGYTYAHLQNNLTIEEIVLAKRTFEVHLRKHNVLVQHHHANNAEAQQTISYCGVNAHFQNGIAEKHICDLQEGARIQLHHAKSRCYGAIDLCLWSYALRCKVHLDNTMPNKANSTCPLEQLTACKQAIPYQNETQGQGWV